jgi:ribosomal-protein-alanine N-acetyltransferase
VKAAPVLRAAAIDDAERLAILHAACFADCWSTGAMIEVLRTQGSFGFVIEIAQLPLCALALARCAADEAELLTIGVAPAWRRHGLARELISAVSDEARTRGARHIFLEVAEDNAAARALYADEGFAPVGRRPGYYARPGVAPVDALTMRRELHRVWRWPWSR